MALFAGAVHVSACGQVEPPVPHVALAPPAPGILRAAEGEKLFFGRAGCSTCHSVNKRGTMVRGPNLGTDAEFAEPLFARAKNRRPELTPLGYIVESIVDPDAFVVHGYAPGVMKRADEPPIQLTDGEILSVATFVASIDNPACPDSADLDAARASIATIRAARDERLAKAKSKTRSNP